MRWPCRRSKWSAWFSSMKHTKTQQFGKLSVLHRHQLEANLQTSNLHLFLPSSFHSGWEFKHILTFDSHKKHDTSSRLYQGTYNHQLQITYFANLDNNITNNTSNITTYLHDTSYGLTNEQTTLLAYELP